MKLLVPRERDALEQKEKERLVNESTSLSTRVDKLRELGETEAKKLQDFQEREFERFRTEKEKRVNEIAQLDTDITRKQAEWAKLLEPLDRQWALYVKTEKGNIEAEQRRQAELAADLSLKADELKIKDEEQQKRAMIFKKERSEIATLKDSVEREKQQAIADASSIRSSASSLQREAEQSRNASKALEEQAQVVLREAQLKTETLDRREKELEDREVKVLIEELKYYSPIHK